MRLNTISNRYIIKEMLAPFSINLLVFTFLFLMTEMIEITDWIVNYNLGLLAVFKIILFTLPWFLMFIIPTFHHSPPPADERNELSSCV